MTKKILIAHDLSRRSSVALARAAQLASQDGAALEILHVVDDDLPPSVIERRREEARGIINHDLSQLSDPALTKVDSVIVAGRDYTDILRQANESQADLIVLGAHREDALRSVVIGTTAERTIGFGSRPVLVVKDSPHGSYRRPVVAFDFSVPARRAAEFTVDLLPEPRLLLVHALPIIVEGVNARSKAAQQIDAMRSQLAAKIALNRSRAPSPDVAIRYGSPIAVIRDAVKESGGDLLVVGVQRRSGLTRALIGEIPEDLLARPPCDVLFVRA